MMWEHGRHAGWIPWRRHKVTVIELLDRAFAEDRAVSLAWPNGNALIPVEHRDFFPLPVPPTKASTMIVDKDLIQKLAG